MSLDAAVGWIICGFPWRRCSPSCQSRQKDNRRWARKTEIRHRKRFMFLLCLVAIGPNVDADTVGVAEAVACAQRVRRRPRGCFYAAWLWFLCVLWLDLFDENERSRQPRGRRRAFEGSTNLAEYSPCQKCSPEKGELCFTTLALLQQTHGAAQVPALAALQMRGHE